MKIAPSGPPDVVNLEGSGQLDGYGLACRRSKLRFYRAGKSTWIEEFSGILEPILQKLALELVLVGLPSFLRRDG